MSQTFKESELSDLRHFSSAAARSFLSDEKVRLEMKLPLSFSRLSSACVSRFRLKTCMLLRPLQASHSPSLEKQLTEYGKSFTVDFRSLVSGS